MDLTRTQITKSQNGDFAWCRACIDSKKLKVKIVDTLNWQLETAVKKVELEKVVALLAAGPSYCCQLREFNLFDCRMWFEVKCRIFVFLNCILIGCGVQTTEFRQINGKLCWK